LARSLQTYEAALTELEGDQVSAILADNVILQGLIAQNPGRFKLVGGLLTSEPYSAAVALGNLNLLDVVNVAIQQYKDSGEWAASYSRYFPDQPVPELSFGRTVVLSALRGRDVIQEIGQRLGIRNGIMQLSKPAESGGLLNKIRQRGYLVVAVKSDVLGLGYRDPNTREFSGLEIDLAREVARVIFGDPSRVRFHAATTQERIPLVRSFIRFLDPILNLYSIFSTWINANWWHLGMAGKLPEFICPPECIGQQDFVGFDYYWGVNNLRPNRIVHLLDAFVLGRDLSRAPVWPWAMYNAIKYSADLFPGQPIFIVENGCVAEADGVDRTQYLREHLRQVQRAVGEGMKVIGYLYWSITSNREWGAKFNGASDFGLYHVELDSDPELKRAATKAADTYKQIITQRDVPES
jgi:ABC-type amino acid transport substrate-binding protein